MTMTTLDRALVTGDAGQLGAYLIAARVGVDAPGLRASRPDVPVTQWLTERDNRRISA
jgi:hypothetical protein